MFPAAGVPVTDARAVRWLALGDSFTIGTGIRANQAFPSVLVRIWSERAIACDLVNPSVNGYTTDDLIRDELPLVGSFEPTMVSVLIGANDIVRGSGEERYRSQLRRIHDAIRGGSAPAPAVFALPQPDWSLAPAGADYGDPAATARTIERFNAIAREEVARAGGRYLDVFPLMREQARRGMFAADRLHPSAEAHAQWAAALDELLRPSPPPGSPHR